MDAFDPPTGDYSGLNSAASLLGSVSTDLSSDLSATSAAITTAVSDWRGTRQDDFAHAGGGAQVQLKVAADGCESVASLMGQYAKAFSQTCADVAEYKRQSDGALSSAATQAKTLDPSSSQYDMAFQHASRQSSQYQSDALSAKAALANLAAQVAAEIDAQTDKVAPVSSSLSPDQIRRQVDAELGLTGLSGSSATTMSTDQAWTLVVGAEKAVSSSAVNANGSVNWSKASATPTVPPSGTDPQTVNDWWNGLSPTEQDELLNKMAGNVGNLDGIPVIDRDFANRVNLPSLISSVQAQIDKLGPEPTEYAGAAYARFGPIPGAQTAAWQAWNSKMTALQQQLESLNAVKKALSKQSPAPLCLIGLQDAGNGRAIISTGNPDTASDVATYVPGMGTKVTGIGGGVDRANAMYYSAQSAGSSSTAVVTWYGYDAPQGLGAAASYNDAKRGAPLLDSFQNGLRITHQGPPSLNTVIAHSYGTTVSGYAASHGNSLNADNVVFVASPGVSVDNVRQLNLSDVSSSQNGTHVYATVGQYDPIQLAAGVNGPSPADLDFGAHDFSADSKAGSWYKLGWNPSAHSSYWDSTNVALKNMGKVIAGYGDQTN